MCHFELLIAFGIEGENQLAPRRNRYTIKMSSWTLTNPKEILFPLAMSECNASPSSQNHIKPLTKPSLTVVTDSHMNDISLKYSPLRFSMSSPPSRHSICECALRFFPPTFRRQRINRFFHRRFFSFAFTNFIIHHNGLRNGNEWMGIQWAPACAGCCAGSGKTKQNERHHNGWTRMNEWKPL